MFGLNDAPAHQVFVDGRLTKMQMEHIPSVGSEVVFIKDGLPLVLAEQTYEHWLFSDGADPVSFCDVNMDRDDAYIGSVVRFDVSRVEWITRYATLRAQDGSTKVRKTLCRIYLGFSGSGSRGVKDTEAT